MKKIKMSWTSANALFEKNRPKDSYEPYHFYRFINTIFNLRSPNKEEFQLSARKTAIVSATFMTAVVKRSHKSKSNKRNLDSTFTIP